MDILAAREGLEDIEAPAALVPWAGPIGLLWVAACTHLWGTDPRPPRPPMGGMGYRPYRNAGCCGCLLPVIGVMGMLLMVLMFLI